MDAAPTWNASPLLAPGRSLTDNCVVSCRLNQKRNAQQSYADNGYADSANVGKVRKIKGMQIKQKWSWLIQRYMIHRKYYAYVENPKGSSKKLPEVKSEFSKVPVYNVCMCVCVDTSVAVDSYRQINVFAMSYQWTI